MTRLPRNFDWFVQNDFIAIQEIVERVLFTIYVLALTAYFAKSFVLYVRSGFLNIGKDIVVATTAICWYVGIVVFNSDYAFTVTNVIIHGVPYFALIYWYSRRRMEQTGGRGVYRMFSRGPPPFFASFLGIGFIEKIFLGPGVLQNPSW